MAVLNDKNEKTEKITHLMVTSLCDRDCKYCCNKQYDLSTIPQVTDDELSKAHTVCLTGGEPFIYSQPIEIANWLKKKYPNIEKVYVYTSAVEFSLYMDQNMHSMDPFLKGIDGVNLSVKENGEIPFMHRSIDHLYLYYKKFRAIDMNNRIYAFTNVYDEAIKLSSFVFAFIDSDFLECCRFDVIKREWQKDFIPADDSIFRRI